VNVGKRDIRKQISKIKEGIIYPLRPINMCVMKGDTKITEGIE
jgi:hypothetical protein